MALDRPLRFALFGDQGLYPFSSVGNLLDDRAAGRIDAVLHLGDAAYNLAMANGTRGDGYLTALEPLLSDIPWVPVIGNHEFEGSPFGAYCPDSEYCQGRYLNQTAGYLAAAAASGSHTGLFFSLNIGPVHVVSLNTMPYLGLGQDTRAAQRAWLAADLTAVNAGANRSATPWVLLLTHVPAYCSAITAGPPPYAGCIADGVPVGDAIRADLEDVWMAGGADLYAAGHVHAVEASWPVGPNASVPRRSLDAPLAPVHLLQGAGGPPGVPEIFSAPGPFTRWTYSNWAYARVTVWNASHLTVDTVSNSDGTVLDSFTINQPRHGPFPGAQLHLT